MLIFNPKRVFTLRGIERPSSFLVKHGISRPTITRLLNNQKSWVSYEHLEKLCILLSCTPNDLFEWRPDKDAPLPDAHPLNELKKETEVPNLKEMMKDIPLEKLNEIAALINESKKSSD